jgi:fructose-specific phosphotransferase system component IIB
LREEVRASRTPLVTTDEGIELAHRIYANRFIECSAKENIRVKDTVEEALRAAINGPVEEEKSSSGGICSIFSCCNRS